MGDVTAGDGFSRRVFLARAGIVAAAAGLWQLTSLVDVEGPAQHALALEPDQVRDTINGLVAFVFPGDDEYSVAQGEDQERPGAIAAGTTDALIESLDRYLPAPYVGDSSGNHTVPLSGAVAGVLNTAALAVNPAASSGAFLSPFSRLSWEQKAHALRLLEEETGLPDHDLPQPLTRASGNTEFLAGILPAFAAFLAFTEWAVWDPDTRTLTERPVGWAHSGYQDGRLTPVEGWDEFHGYYQDRRSVES